MPRINILFVMLQMEMGGAERLVHNLACNLDRSRFKPAVAWFFGDTVLNEFKDLDIPLYHVPKRKRVDLGAMQTLGEIIRKEDIHIVNAHHFMSMFYSFYGSKIKNNAKLVYTEHSEWEIDHISWKWKIIGHYFMSRAEAAVGVSQPISARIQEKFKAEQSKIVTIQNGVSLESVSPVCNRVALKKNLGLANTDKVIGIVANFRQVKNHLFLLKAFAKIIKDYSNTKLLLIGQGFKFDPENSEQELRNFVRENNLQKNVLFLGYRPDIPDILGIMDVFCLTSHKEGLPISLIEAMASGLPVVGTNTDGIKDVIISNRNGFLVETDDVEALKDRLSLLINNEPLRSEFGRESKAIATAHYSLNRCINQYQDLFASMTCG